MISRYDVPGMIRHSFQKEMETDRSLIKPSPFDFSPDVYESVRALAALTKGALNEGDLLLAARCFQLAEEIYFGGDDLVKSVMENIYVFSLSSCITKDNDAGICYRAIVPPRFYSICIHQMIDSGI